MPTITNHTELRIWNASIDLAVETYRITARFPREEQFGLTAQSRRAAVSVSGNIAEGNGRRTRRGYIQSLYTARGSLRELHSHITIGLRLEYVNEEQLARFRELLDHVGRMLTKLIARLESTSQVFRPPSPDPLGR
jgi:four helix bundle protein